MDAPQDDKIERDRAIDAWHDRINDINDICNTTIVYGSMSREEVVKLFNDTLAKIARLADYPPPEPAREQVADQALDQVLAEIGTHAATMIGQISAPLLDAIHEVIRRQPANIVTATLAAVLSDVIAYVSKTEDAADNSVLVVSEAMRRQVIAGIARNRKVAAAHTSLTAKPVPEVRH